MCVCDGGEGWGALTLDLLLFVKRNTSAHKKRVKEAGGGGGCLQQIRPCTRSDISCLYNAS